MSDRLDTVIVEAHARPDFIYYGDIVGAKVYTFKSYPMNTLQRKCLSKYKHTRVFNMCRRTLWDSL